MTVRDYVENKWQQILNGGRAPYYVEKDGEKVDPEKYYDCECEVEYNVDGLYDIVKVK